MFPLSLKLSVVQKLYSTVDGSLAPYLGICLYLSKSSIALPEEVSSRNISLCLTCSKTNTMFVSHMLPVDYLVHIYTNTIQNFTLNSLHLSCVALPPFTFFPFWEITYYIYTTKCVSISCHPFFHKLQDRFSCTQGNVRVHHCVSL